MKLWAKCDLTKERSERCIRITLCTEQIESISGSGFIQNGTAHNTTAATTYMSSCKGEGGGGVEIRIYFGILFEIQVHHNILLINVACHFYCAGESLSDPWMVGDGYRNNAGVTEVVSRILCKWV